MCILQARATSTRLPGKVLEPVLGRPMLARQIERIQAASRLDALVVATSDQGSDDPIATLCAGLGVECHRGSLDDVLDRFHGAAGPVRPSHVMRLTGDCPLTDPEVLDALVGLHLDGDFDYSSNTQQRTFPHGLDAEIFTLALLERAWREARSPYEREHVTPFMYAPPTGARQGVLLDAVDRSRMRWTVDYPEDLEFVRGVFGALYPAKPAFTRNDVYALLEVRPELVELNARHAIH